VERDGFGGTFKAFETGDAVLLPVFLRIRFGNRPHRALLHTLQALGAVLRDKTPQDSETRHDGKESPQGTEVAAPESFSHDPQAKDHDKKEKDQKVDLEHRHWNRRQEERVPGEKALNFRNERIEDKDGRRVKSNHERSGEEADRIEEVHHLEGHQTRHKRKNKNSIAEPSEGLVIQAFGPLPLSEENSVKKIDGGAHGAEPSAEEIAKNENGEEHSKGRKHSQNDLFLRKDRDDPDEGIKAKVEVHRNFKLKGKSGLDNEIEKEEK
jgi:hypothetical protein